MPTMSIPESRSCVRAATARMILAVRGSHAGLRPFLGLGWTSSRIKALAEGDEALPTRAEFFAAAYLSGMSPQDAVQTFAFGLAPLGPTMVDPDGQDVLERSRQIQQQKNWIDRDTPWAPVVVESILEAQNGPAFPSVVAGLVGCDPSYLSKISRSQARPNPPTDARLIHLAGMKLTAVWGLDQLIGDQEWVHLAEVAFDSLASWTQAQRGGEQATGAAEAADRDDYEIQALGASLPLPAALETFGAGVNLLLQDARQNRMWRWACHWPRPGRPTFRANVCEIDPETYVELDDVRSIDAQADTLDGVIGAMIEKFPPLEFLPVVSLRWPIGGGDGREVHHTETEAPPRTEDLELFRAIFGMEA